MSLSFFSRHMIVKIIGLFSFLSISNYSFSQSEEIDFSDFGAFKPEEVNYKICPFDKDADAVVFFDKAISNYDNEYNLVTTRSVRFKILKEKGKERGDIRIYYQSGDDFEYVRDIDVVVMSYDDQGNRITNKIDRKSIFRTKVNDAFSYVSFASPNVKVGSIIEYKYTSISKSYQGLRDWQFQKEIPVLLSCYKLYVIPNHEFAYTVYKSSFMPIDIKPDRSSGTVFFTMKDIPGLRDEAYMASARDYIQRVTFQLSGYTTHIGNNKVSTTWKELTKELLDEPEFGGTLSKTLSGTEELKSSCDKLTNLFDKIKLLHNYVRSTMTWDHIYSLYCEDGIKTVWDRKKGHSGEINLVLINLLRSNGLNAYPLLVSEREDGKVDTTYPYLRQFSNVVALVDLGGKTVILDALDKITPTGTTPFDLLNTKGFIVDRKRIGFITITDDQRKDKDVINVLAQVDATGSLTGQAAVYNFDYAKIYKSNAFSNDVLKYRDAYMVKYPSMKVDSLKISGLENDSLPLVETFQISTPVTKSGNYFLLNYNLFTGLEKNPFVSEHRFSKIDFGCQHTTLVNGLFSLNENIDVESLPKSISMRTPDNSITMSRVIEKQDQTIRVLLKMEVQKTEFDAEDYDMIQSFYKKVFEMLNEPIVLKTK